MKRLILALAGVALAGTAADLKPLDEAGYRALVAAGKGKVLLVNFWATYCGPCRKEMPALVAMHKRLAGQGLQFVTVTADEPEQEPEARKFLDEVRVAPPVFIKRAKDDDQFINAIDPKWSGALPATFLYDRAGRKVRSYFGEVDLGKLEADVKQVLGR